jgi:hypothetical protein
VAYQTLREPLITKQRRPFVARAFFRNSSGIAVPNGQNRRLVEVVGGGWKARLACAVSRRLSDSVPVDEELLPRRRGGRGRRENLDVVLDIRSPGLGQRVLPARCHRERTDGHLAPGRTDNTARTEHRYPSRPTS